MTDFRWKRALRHAGPFILLALALLVTPGVAGAAAPQGDEPPTTNWALQFDGAGNYVDLSPSSLGTPTSLTVEAWVRIEELGKLHYLVTDANDDYNDGFSLTVGADGRVNFVVASSVTAKAIAVSSTSLQIGEWHHVAGVYDGASDAVKVYVDGVEEVAVAYGDGINYSGSRDLFFGSQHKGYYRNSRYLKGALDEIRIWALARTAADVAGTMRVEIDPESSDLVGYWRFNEGTGVSAEDMTGGSDGTLRGPVWIEAGWESAAAMEVAIDVRPFSRGNLISRSRGKIPVALLSAEDFDAARDVERRSLTFGRTGSEPSLHLYWGGRPHCRSWDVNRDRRSDLVCWFEARLMDFGPEDSRGVLKGMTAGGTEIVGSDAIKLNGFTRRRSTERHSADRGQR